MVAPGISLSSFLACNSRLRSTVRQPHPPQRPVLGHIHCFMQCEIVNLRCCCTVLSHVMWRRPRGLLQSSGGRVDRIFLASALSPIRAICAQKRSGIVIGIREMVNPVESLSSVGLIMPKLTTGMDIRYKIRFPDNSCIEDALKT